jgi:arabinogalactan oligomer/maltooligosaccharide transport system substrate-binding protein
MLKNRLNKLIIILFLINILFFNIKVSAATELKIWVNKGQETKWMEKMATNYQTETGVKVNIESVQELDQSERLTLAIPKGTDADIVSWPHDKIGYAVQKGLIKPIGDDLADDYLEESFPQNSLNALSYKGDLYGLPYAYQTLALIYNKDIYSQIPNDLEKFIELAKSKTNAEQNQYGFSFPIYNFWTSAGFIQGYGGYIFGRKEDGQYDVYDIGLDTEGALKGVKLLKRFRDEGLIPRGVTGEKAYDLFLEGKVGAMLTGDWGLANIEESGIDYGTATLPQLEGNNIYRPFITVKGYYLSQGSSNPKEAIKFMKYITNAKASIDHYQSNTILVPHKALIDSSIMEEDKLLDSFLEQAQTGFPTPNIPEMKTVWNSTNNSLWFILDGRLDPGKGMKMAENLILQKIKKIHR